MKTRRARHESHRSRLRTYSFIATLTLIAVITVAYYNASQPSIGHMPSTIQFNQQAWMKAIPSQVQYVGYVSYDSAYALTANSSMFGSQVLLQLPQLNFTIYPRDVQYEVDIQLPSPQFSGTVSIIGLDQSHLTSLAGVLTNTSANHNSVSYDGYMVHSLLSKEFGQTQPTLTYLTVASAQIILSNNKASGMQNVQQILDEVSSNAPSLFDNVTVREALYAAGATTQNYVALFLGMFPTQLTGSNMVVKSVSSDGSSLTVTRGFLFSSLDAASASFAQAQQIYSGGQYKILDSWLIVVNQYSLNQLRTELSGI